MFKYSEKIIQETIKIFKEEEGLDISEETANEYCDNLGGLFLAFSYKN
jgi:hypothetical protein